MTMPLPSLPMITAVALVAESPSLSVSVATDDGAIWYDTLDAPPDTALRVALTGWISGGGVVTPYVAPPPEIPAQVTRTQALLALLEHDPPIAEAGILGAIDALAEADANVARILFANPFWRRDDPFIAILGAAFGLDAPAIDALFVLAATK